MTPLLSTLPIDDCPSVLHSEGEKSTPQTEIKPLPSITGNNLYQSTTPLATTASSCCHAYTQFGEQDYFVRIINQCIVQFDELF